MAETLPPITEKISEVKEDTRKLGKIVKESNTPRLVIKNIHKAIPVENEQIHPGVTYETSIENTQKK